MRMAFYSHDTMGLGHIRRNLAIAGRLLESHAGTALLVTGTREATAFAMPPGCECLSLPSLMKDAAGRYRSRALDVSLDEVIAVRAAAIRAALGSFAPDVFVVDKAPRGVHAELVPALEMLRARGTTRCVLGLRDVLDDPDTVDREWNAEDNGAAVDRYYEAVWVYGDPRVYDTVAENPVLAAIRPPVAYTGYLAPPAFAPSRRASATVRALCLVGGGQDGAALARAFVACRFDETVQGVLVVGPFMPEAERRALEEAASRSGGPRVLRFQPDLAPLLADASHVVAMGGYNTVCELLRLDRPSLLVPRVVPRTEQAIRAERLEQLGWVEVLRPDALSAARIEAWLRSPASPPRLRTPIDLDGLARLPDLVSALEAAHPARLGVCP